MKTSTFSTGKVSVLITSSTPPSSSMTTLNFSRYSGAVSRDSWPSGVRVNRWKYVNTVSPPFTATLRLPPDPGVSELADI
jgi:hypothetical protein